MTDEKLRYWSDDWILGEDTIECSQCHAIQLMEDKDDEFVHGPACPREGPSQRPYWDLNELLKKSMASWKQ